MAPFPSDWASTSKSIQKASPSCGGAHRQARASLDFDGDVRLLLGRRDDATLSGDFTPGAGLNDSQIEILEELYFGLDLSAQHWTDEEDAEMWTEARDRGHPSWDQRPRAMLTRFSEGMGQLGVYRIVHSV